MTKPPSPTKPQPSPGLGPPNQAPKPYPLREGLGGLGRGRSEGSVGREVVRAWFGGAPWLRQPRWAL